MSWLYGSTATSLSGVQDVGMTQLEAYSSSAHACRAAVLMGPQHSESGATSRSRA